MSDTLSDTDDDEDVEAEGIPPGTTFASFVVQRPLGRGGMGAVYEAFDTRLERSVALKVLPAEFLHDPTFAKRFEREARLAARLEHPNIVPIYASGIEQGVPWMSMRLLAGQNLSVLLRERRLSAPEALTLLKQVAAALDHAHALGVVHRDIKPANILLDRAGVASVGDFGLAQLMDSGVRLTRTGMLSGTPHYMAPEQALGQRVGHRCDIYALGIVAYEMLLGRTPFAGDSPVAVLLQQVNAPLPAAAGEHLPAGCMSAIDKATAKNPAERWPSAGAFVDALNSALAVTPVALDAETQPIRARRIPLGPIAVAAGTVLVIAALLWLLVTSPDPPPDATVAARGEQATPEGPTPAPPPAQPSDATGQTSTAGGQSPAADPSQRSRSKPDPTDRESTLTPNDGTPAPPPPPPLPYVVVVEGLRGLQSLPHLSGPVPPALPEDEFTPPEIVKEQTPDYPDTALRAKVEGKVTLRCTVNIDGTVTDIEVVDSSHNVFRPPAVEALRRTRFRPALRNGKPVRHTVTRTILFTLNDRD